MHGAFAALKKVIWAAMRSFSASISPSSKRPENQPPQTEIPYFARVGFRTFASMGKRRPVSMPVKPATLAWRKHSSSETSSLSSARSSFHQAMGAMPNFAFMTCSVLSNADALLLAHIGLVLGGFVYFLAGAHLGHAHVPQGIARGPCEGVGDDGDDGGAVIC